MPIDSIPKDQLRIRNTKASYTGNKKSRQVIIGPKEFVSANYQRFKNLFASKHEKKPKPIKGLEGIYSLKRLSEIIWKIGKDFLGKI